MKKLSYIFIGLLSFLAPIIFYISHFNTQLSNKNADWAAFGSFISGIYAFLSTMILATTLYITQKSNKAIYDSNKEQLALTRDELAQSRAERTKSEFILLLDKLEKKLSNKVYPNRQKESDFFFDRETNTMKYFLDYLPRHEIQLFNTATMVMKNHESLYKEESLILNEMLFRIDTTEGVVKSTLKSLLIFTISNERRFWLSRYSENFIPYTKASLESWPDFAVLPEKLSAIIQTDTNAPF